MPADRLAPAVPGQRVIAAQPRRHSESRADTALQSRRHIRDLFGKIEQEFERVYSENVAMHERLDQLTERLSGVSMHQIDSSAALSNMASPPATMASPSTTTTATEDGQKSAKKGSQLSQKLKSTYKTSTTKLANTFRISGCGRFIREFVGHTDGVWDVSAGICYGVPILLTASADCTAKVWSANTGCILLEYCGHHGSVNSVRLHPFKSLAVTASGDRTAHVWTVQPALVAQQSPPAPIVVASSPPPARRPVMSPSSSFAGLAALLSRRSHSLPNGDGLENGSLALAASTFSHGMASTVAVLTDDARADYATASDEPDAGVLRRGDSLPCATTTQLSPSCIRSPLAVLCGHSDVVSAADWLCDGTRVVTASWDGNAALHDVERCVAGSSTTGISSSASSVVETLSGHDRELTNVCAHGSQLLVLTSSKDMSVRLWDLRVPSVAVNAFLGHTASVSSAVFAPHDRIVSGGDDRMVKLWDMRNMATPFITIRGDSAVNRLSVCPTTGNVAVPHDNRHIRLYDGTTGARLGRMPRSSRLGHSRMVCSTAWLDDCWLSSASGSFNGNRNLACNLFSAGFDGRVLGWRTYARVS